jgi:hypothetical protein
MGFDGDGLLSTEGSTPTSAKEMLVRLPQGAYTTCRTVGGARQGGKVLMLAFHIARLEESLRLLFPSLDLDAAAANSSNLAPVEVGGGGDACDSMAGTHDDLLPIDPCCEDAGAEAAGAAGALPGASEGNVRIFFAGEPDSRNLVAAEEGAKVVLERAAGGRGEIVSMRSLDATKVVECIRNQTHCIFVVECESDGDLSFGAKKMLRALKTANLTGLTFSVLVLARSSCANSAAQLGGAKFKGGINLDSLLAQRGASRLCPLASIDVEMDDLIRESESWVAQLATALQAGGGANHGGAPAACSPERREAAASPLRCFLKRELCARISRVLAQDTSSASAGAPAPAQGDAMIVALCCPCPKVEAQEHAQGGGGGQSPRSEGYILKMAVMSSPLPAPKPSVIVQVPETPKSQAPNPNPGSLRRVEACGGTGSSSGERTSPRALQRQRMGRRARAARSKQARRRRRGAPLRCNGRAPPRRARHELLRH